MILVSEIRSTDELEISAQKPIEHDHDYELNINWIWIKYECIEYDYEYELMPGSCNTSTHFEISTHSRRFELLSASSQHVPK